MKKFKCGRCGKNISIPKEGEVWLEFEGYDVCEECYSLLEDENHAPAPESFETED